MLLYTGSRGDYRWLTSEDHELFDLMRLCPETVLDKYLAITAIDSGVLEVTDVEKAEGWETRQNIAYSPRVKSVAGLPHENRHGCCPAGFDEWYVFDTPTDLGERCDSNIFEAHLQSGRVWPFVNFYGFELHEPERSDITDLFWKQMEWIQPESFIADGNSYLTFVTRDKDLYIAVKKTLATHS
jgi:hypothetical protein